MIELGAYWGHYSMWLKRVKPRSTVILVEPDPVNLAAGVTNFKNNGLIGEFIRSAVGRGHLHVDAFLAERHLDRLDVLHVDIQGQELEMLEGCGGTLAERRADYLFISTHSQAIHERVLREMSEFGYRVEVSSDFDNDTTSHDGLVFASSPEAVQIFQAFRLMGRTRIAGSRPRDLLQELSEIR